MSPGEPTATLVPDAATRGTLTIHDRVVRRIVERAAAEVAGQGPRSSAWQRLGSQTVPRATASVVGRHVRLAVAVPAPAGRSLPELAGSVRDAVGRQVGDLTGLHVDLVDVQVEQVSRQRPAGHDAAPLPAATRPAAPGAARKAGLLVALLLIALGAAAVYDAIVGPGLVAGRELVVPLLERIDGLAPRWWMTPVGVGVALVGLWLLVSALRRRPRRSLPVTARTGVYASRGAVEALSIDSAVGHGGVLDAKATARPKAVVMRVTTDGEAETAGEVRLRVTERLARLAGPPRVRVRARRQRGWR